MGDDFLYHSCSGIHPSIHPSIYPVQSTGQFTQDIIILCPLHHSPISQSPTLSISGTTPHCLDVGFGAASFMAWHQPPKASPYYYYRQTSCCYLSSVCDSAEEKQMKPPTKLLLSPFIFLYVRTRGTIFILLIYILMMQKHKP